MEILRIEDLSFSYPAAEKKALKNVSLTVREGEFILLCGGSGCGKTTLLRLLKNELAPAGELTGGIFFRERGMRGLSQRESASRIGFVMQDPDSQIVTDKVWHELAFGPENLGLPNDVIRRRVAETAGYFGIGHLFDRNTDELSGGQKQLLNLAAVMTMQPEILLLDEPSSQLDPIAAAEFIATLKKINTELGLTVILAEHRLEEVFPAADRAVVMEDGEIISSCAVRDTAAALKKSGRGKSILPGLPAASRIYAALENGGTAPVTVREGREYLRSRQDTPASGAEPVKKPRGETVLELKDVSFRYEKNTPDVLRSLSVKAYAGEIFAVLGGNGTGKTTMLNCIAGLSRPYAGTVRILGRKQKEYKGGSLYRGTLSYLPQDPKTVFVKDSVGEDLAALCKSLGKTSEEGEKLIEELARRFGITELLGRHPYDLSGGEQQKAALVKMLLSDPAVLLMDEPTKGLDACAKLGLGEMLRQLRGEGKTVITVTHDVEFAAVFADRCALFFSGEIFSEGTPREFFADNNFYTTAANRIARGIVDGAVTVEDITEAYRNGRQEKKN